MFVLNTGIIFISIQYGLIDLYFIYILIYKHIILILNCHYIYEYNDICKI